MNRFRRVIGIVVMMLMLIDSVGSAVFAEEGSGAPPDITETAAPSSGDPDGESGDDTSGGEEPGEHAPEGSSGDDGDPPSDSGDEAGRDDGAAPGDDPVTDAGSSTEEQLDSGGAGDIESITDDAANEPGVGILNLPPTWGPADPSVDVRIVDLSLSCSGVVTFTTVVNIEYERFTGHLSVAIHEGDPAAGGVWVEEPNVWLDDGLVAGTTPYTVDKSGVTSGLADPYVVVHWQLSAWEGPNDASDYVDNWGGTAVAPMDSDCGEPIPTDELVQLIIRIILEILARLNA